MKAHSSLVCILIICLTLSTLSGCSRSPRVAFYTLSSESKPDTSAVGGRVYSIVVGPVSIPELYDRPQLVIRTDTNRVELLESHRWASPLKSELPKILAENLASMLVAANVTTYSRTNGQDADVRVIVDIQRFDMTPGKGIDFEALWSLSRAGKLLKRGKTSVHESVSGVRNDDLIAAYDRALATLSRDVAPFLRAEKP